MSLVRVYGQPFLVRFDHSLGRRGRLSFRVRPPGREFRIHLRLTLASVRSADVQSSASRQ